MYDSTPTANLNTGSQSIDNIIAGDEVTATVAGTYQSEHAGDNIVVDLAWTFAGADKDNYEYDAQGTTVASITKRLLTIDGIFSPNKSYDGGLTALISTEEMELAGLVHGDDVQVTVTGMYPSARSGVGYTVDLTIDVQGTDVENYELDKQETTVSSILTTSTLYRLFASC